MVRGGAGPTPRIRDDQRGSFQVYDTSLQRRGVTVPVRFSRLSTWGVSLLTFHAVFREQSPGSSGTMEFWLTAEGAVRIFKDTYLLDFEPRVSAGTRVDHVHVSTYLNLVVWMDGYRMFVHSHLIRPFSQGLSSYTILGSGICDLVGNPLVPRSLRLRRVDSLNRAGLTQRSFYGQIWGDRSYPYTTTAKYCPPKYKLQQPCLVAVYQIMLLGVWSGSGTTTPFLQ